ncbi:MAG: hypothetical protein JWM16_678, partial [Verrucomicrobiales bacterium]|nr:hypothetical protein [Verrucomicrobiales bacterium]
MSGFEMFALAGAAAAAGMVNAVAGGGTLITFPVLLLFGTPAIVANATSTLALVIGTTSSVYSFRRQIAEVKPWLKRFLPVSLVGGLAGGILLTHTQEKVFAKLVPFLLLFATVIFLTQGFFRKFAITGEGGSQAPLPRHAFWGAMIFQFSVSVYGGYFGAGIGILMLSSLAFLGLKDIHQINALKTYLAFCMNVVAAGLFIYRDWVRWDYALAMAGAAIIGGYLGARLSLFM